MIIAYTEINGKIVEEGRYDSPSDLFYEHPEAYKEDGKWFVS